MESRKRRLRHFGLALLFGLAFAGLASLKVFDHFQRLDIDLHHAIQSAFSVRDVKELHSPTVVVALDEATYSSSPFVGLPRVMWTPQIAAVQNAILAGGAKVVGWDLILPTSAATYVVDRNFDRPLLLSLSNARKGNKVVLGMSHIGRNVIQPHRLFILMAGGAKNLRSLDVFTDDDGVVRAIPTFVKVRRSDGRESLKPSMALEIAARLIGQRPKAQSDGKLQFGDRPIRGVRQNNITLNYASSLGNIPTFSLADLWRCAQQGQSAFFEKNFRGRAVLFGLVLDVEDRKLSSNRLTSDSRPRGPVITCNDSRDAPQPNRRARRATMPGVYLIATAVNNFVANEALVEFSRVDRFLAALSLATVAAAATFWLGVRGAVTVAVAAGLGWLGLAKFAFGNAYVLPLLLPFLVYALTTACGLGQRYVFLEREGRFLRQAFSSYVSPALVAELVENPSRLTLGGERRELSFLFTDLADFTNLMEQLDPKRSVQLINAYLDTLIEVAKRHGGTIDKVVGDAVVVFFSAPLDQNDHADRAVACALEIDAVATAFAEGQRIQGIAFGQTRIGVHTGVAVVGNFGGSGFFDYTAMGDAINTAARLESANKQLGTRIAISGETVKKTHRFSGRLIGRVVLKGKTEAVDVYEPWPNANTASDRESPYNDAFQLLHRRSPQAKTAFQKLATAHPEDGVVALHYKRLKAGESGSLIVLDEK